MFFGQVLKRRSIRREEESGGTLTLPHSVTNQLRFQSSHAICCLAKDK